MNLTKNQTQLINELKEEFVKLNQTQCPSNDFSLFNLNDIMSNEDEEDRQFKEIELHNAIMNKHQMQVMFDIADKLDADFKKAGLNLRCVIDKENAIKYQTPRSIRIEPYMRSTFMCSKETKVNTLIGEIFYIEPRAMSVLTNFNSRFIYKITHFTYGNFCGGETQYKKVEDYLNSELVKNKFGVLYRKYCK